MINHLYIIGNGFDLHHEIPSNYNKVSYLRQYSKFYLNITY